MKFTASHERTSHPGDNHIGLRNRRPFGAALLWGALVFIALPCLVNAQTSSAPPTVVSVEVVGAKTSSVDLIKSVANILPGSALNSAQLRDALERLDGLSLFEDVEFRVEEVQDGVVLYIVVKERAKLEKISFVGADKVSAGKLRDEVKLQPGALVTGFTFFDAKQKILRKYADEGYFLTTVDYTLTYNADSSQVSAVYNINENEKIKVRTVSITGMVQMDSSKLVSVMSNRKKGFLKSSNFNRDKYSEDLEKVIEEYHKHGFIDAYMISDSTVVDSAANRIDIYLDTYEGPRYYFGEPSFTDNDIFTDEQLSHSLKYAPGDIFDQEQYDETIFEIYSAYQEVGHLHVRIDDKRTFKDSVINVEYVITEGLPSKVNLVSISGNVKTKDKVIRRELSVLPGQTFHRSLLMRSLRDVMALNYFSNVVPDVKNLPNGDVDVDVKVEEKQTGQLNAGAGYSARPAGRHVRYGHSKSVRQWANIELQSRVRRAAQ